MKNAYLCAKIHEVKNNLFQPIIIQAMQLNPKNLWRSGRDYIMITFGAALYAFGYCSFVLPEKVVIGGVTGLGSIVFFLTGWPFAIGLVQYGINFLLLCMAWKIVGKRFVFHTIYGATMLSVFMTIMPFLLPHTIDATGGFVPQALIPGESFMNVAIGALLAGTGLGLVFIHNGSTGGTDIVAAMVAQKTNAAIGRIILYVDFCIICSSFLIFHQIPSVVYGFIYLILVSYMVDLIINTNRQAVQFTIFSPAWDKIAQAINVYAHRGVTVIDGMGWYTHKPTKILMVYARKIEAVTIYRIIKSIDPDAFVSQGNVSGVYGRGFDHIHLKDDENLTREVKKVLNEDAPES